MKNIASIFSLMLIILMVSCSEQIDEPADKIIFQNSDEMVDAAKESITEMSVEDFHAIFNAEEYFLIDTRTKSEHGSGYIPGSINITRGLLEFQIAKESVWSKAEMYMPEKEELIIVYCKKGNRAALAAETLEKLGYTNVKSIEGGWVKWKNTYPELFEVKVSAGSAHVEEEGGC
jgi:rhodanese-related sulfurtransferase